MADTDESGADENASELKTRGVKMTIKLEWER